MDFRWFPPKDAQRLLQRGLEADLIELQAGSIHPTFDVASVEVPLDFSPTPEMLEAPTPNSNELFRRIVDAIVVHTGSDLRAVIATINGIQERTDIDVEVAALIAAHKAGVEIRPYLKPVEARLGLS